jgi:GNAT superfamily N-acetyltransferase
MELILVEVTSDDSDLWPAVESLICLLRPTLTAAGFADFVALARPQGLVLTAACDRHGRCVGVSTHRVLATSRGPVLFVDDLVTASDARSAGVGARLFEGLVDRARRAGCDRIELDSGVTNQAAHRFYHARRMSVVALHFAIDVAIDTAAG